MNSSLVSRREIYKFISGVNAQLAYRGIRFFRNVFFAVSFHDQGLLSENPIKPLAIEICRAAAEVACRQPARGHGLQKPATGNTMKSQPPGIDRIQSLQAAARRQCRQLPGSR
jgi:hypothetical protein